MNTLFINLALLSPSKSPVENKSNEAQIDEMRIAPRTALWCTMYNCRTVEESNRAVKMTVSWRHYGRMLRCTHSFLISSVYKYIVQHPQWKLNLGRINIWFDHSELDSCLRFLQGNDSQFKLILKTWNTSFILQNADMQIRCGFLLPTLAFSKILQDIGNTFSEKLHEFDFVKIFRTVLT